MLILLTKSQLALFEKLVPVKGHVTADGTVVKPHVARRHVAPEQAAPVKPTSRQGDLFGSGSHPILLSAAKKPKPAETAGDDLFAYAEKHPESAAKPANPTPPRPIEERLNRLAERRGEARKGREKREYVEAAAVAPEAAPAAVAPVHLASGLDYNCAFADVSVPAFGVPAGVSKGERRKLNARAAAMVGAVGAGDLDAFAAPEPVDPAILRQYSGNGGCGDSLNEFYTPPAVAAAMWHALKRLGLPDDAAVLEPSCATGVFLETAPAGTKVTGVELDAVSARIAKNLHPGHEIVEGSLEGFATTDTRQFDAVVGNAPFGIRGGFAKQDKDDLRTAEAYFMDTSLDKTKAGGLVAMIVPTGILNGKNSRKVRQRLLCKGEFLGAARMPNTAFEHSHTDVTTDVLFFRKRPDDVAAALSAAPKGVLKTMGVWDDEYLGGGYYDGRGAANLFGTPGKAMRAFGEIDTVDGSMEGVPEALAAVSLDKPKGSPSVEAILEACPEEDRERVRSAAARRPYDTAVRGSLKVVDGEQYILEGSPLRWHRLSDFAASKAVSDAVDLGAAINHAIAGGDAAGLEARVRAYIDEHGVPAKSDDLQIAAHRDKDIYALIGAVKPDGSLSDVVLGRHAKQASTLDSAATSLALQDGDGRFTPEQLAARWAGGTADAALDQLYASPDYAIDPADGRWTTMDVYATGDLWALRDRHLDVLAGDTLPAADRAKLERQAARLDEMIDAKSLDDVEVELNSGFVPLSVVADFFNQKRGPNHHNGLMTVALDRGLYTVSDGGAVAGYGDGKLLSKYLNRTGVKVEDEWPQIDAWNREFKAWVCGSKHRDVVEAAYNRAYRGFRQRAFSDEPFDIPGLANRDRIKPHVYSGVRQALAQGKGILADDVGLGKTVQGLILARMLKSNGKASKPVIPVPKSVLANWAAEAEMWFPGCSILTIGETFTRDATGALKGRADSPAERARKLNDLRQNDYDFVLISQPSWNEIDLDPVTKKEMHDKQFDTQRGDSLESAGDKYTRKIRGAWEQAKDRLSFKKRTDAVYFNELGIDAIVGDEAHAWKNLFSAKNQRGSAPKFLGGSGQSARAQDMHLKSNWLLEQTGGTGVYFLTATPTKNSPLEVYSMLAHIAPEEFEARGIRNSEDFINRYCEFKQEPILNTRGEIEEASVTAGFKNMDELRELMRKFINRRTAEDVDLQLPERDDHQHLVDMSPEQEAVYATLREQAEEAAHTKDASGDLHIFSVLSRMAKAAIDLELLDPDTYPDAKSPKLDRAVENIVEGAKEGGQVVFAENIAIHGKLSKLLQAAGFKPEEIGIFNADEAASSTKRQKLSDDFNAGKLKVVIGNATMEEGVNLQKRTTDLHHLDLPWNAATMQQRNGRGLRQGNANKAVRIHTYLTKGSFDGYRYQTIAAKKSWSDLLWKGGDRVENLAKEGPVSRDDMAVMLSADPEAARLRMDAVKGAAHARFDAEQNAAMAADVARYRTMKASFDKLSPAMRDAESGRRLKVKLDRARVALEANDRLADKSVIDRKGALVIEPTTGVVFHEGVAFEGPPTGAGTDQKPGDKFVVLGIAPGDKEVNVRVRRYGQPTEKTTLRYGQTESSLLMPLSALAGAKPFNLDAKAEEAEYAAHVAKAAAANLHSLKGLADLHGMPASVVKANYDVIQRQARDGAANYKFDLGYGKVGLVDESGRPQVYDGYNARAQLKDGKHLLLPTDEHRAATQRAFMDAERGKAFKSVFVPQTSGRGSRSGGGSYEQQLHYPGGGTGNPWGEVADNVFGKGTAKAWADVHEGERLAAARRADSLQDALKQVAPTKSGHGGWSKKSLATVWAKAKQKDSLDGAWGYHRGDLPADHFSTGWSPSRAIPDGAKVSDALVDLAKHAGHHDLAAAMITDTAAAPEERVRRLLALRGGARAPAIAHLVAKHPDLGRSRLVDLVGPYGPAPEGLVTTASDGYGGERKADPWNWRGRTLSELSERESGVDLSDDEGTRRAA